MNKSGQPSLCSGNSPRLPGLAALLLFGAAIAPQLGMSAEEPPWFRRHLVGMEIGPTGAQFGHSDPDDRRYCRAFDGRRIVRACAEAGAEYLVAWARDGDYAYYDSRLLPKAPGLGDRDPLREAVEEAAALKLPLVAYCVVQQGGHFLREHPELEMRDPQGNRIGRFCYNSGYLEPVKRILAEQLAYGIDGFHIDMLDQGFGPPYGCWCDHCRRLFREEHGCDMPPGPTWDEPWRKMLEFRYRSSERFEKALRDHVKELDPRATVDFNYHGNPPFSWEVGQRPVQHAAAGDFVTGETGVWGFSALTVGLNAEFYRAAAPGRPFQVAMQRGVRMYHDQTTRPLNDMRWELLTLLAHGALVTLVDKTAFDGSLDPVAYERFAELFAEARRKRAHFGHAPWHEVGIYFSAATRDWLGRERPAGYFQAFQGAHKALAYEHIPWGVVLDENLSLERLEAFRVLLVPHAAVLSETEIATFRDYVAAGGRLVATGWTGTADASGNFLSNHPFETLAGAKAVRRLDSSDNWICFPGDAGEEALFSRGIRPDWPFLVEGPAVAYEPTTARPVGRLLAPVRTTRQREGRESTDWPMSPGEDAGPAVLVNRLGRGTVVTFACSPDVSTAGEHAIAESRRLIRNALDFCNRSPRVRIDAPLGVQTVTTLERGDSGETMRVHFLAYNAPPQTTPAERRPYVLPAMIEEAPMYRASVELDREPTAVDLVSADRDALPPGPADEASAGGARIVRDGRRIRLFVDDIHEVLVIRF